MHLVQSGSAYITYLTLDISSACVKNVLDGNARWHVGAVGRASDL